MKIREDSKIRTIEDLDEYISYSHHCLVEDEIDKALDKGTNLDLLYQHQHLTERQIDIALGIGLYLKELLLFNKLNEEQEEEIKLRLVIMEDD